MRYMAIIQECVGVTSEKEQITLISKEVVKVISMVGNIAMIKPYNSRKTYAVKVNNLINIKNQAKKNFFVQFGRRFAYNYN